MLPLLMAMASFWLQWSQRDHLGAVETTCELLLSVIAMAIGHQLLAEPFRGRRFAQFGMALACLSLINLPILRFMLQFVIGWILGA